MQQLDNNTSSSLVQDYFVSKQWDNTRSREQNLRNKLYSRRGRDQIVGFKNYTQLGVKFTAGDILAVVLERGPYGHMIEGICMSVRKRSFINKHAAILIRNVLMGVGVEFTLSYYYHRIYKLQMRDYKRKKFDYVNSNKLYYLRYRDNRETQVRV